ncbi:MAG TPA: aminotransferase class V-fold PLP-dependent enzyme [Steroidobacteraceae bacterium]|jgi:selenocysteine lyase/cysteine desulfurase|nr:aminotransferase class V-fold PLP-dependent enzyme [Steroidobacteraceae bacterium]
MPALDIKRLRSDTPGCEQRIHLNNAGAALMPSPVVQAILDHIALESRIGGYEAADARHDAVQGAYQSVADLIGTQPRNIAFTENATASVSLALSSIPFVRGDVILTTRNDYASNQIQLLSLQARMGVRILRAPDRSEGGVDVQAMAELIRRHRVRLVCVTHIPTNSGLVQDVRAIGAVCRDAGVLYLVDACQSIGQLPVDAVELGCDFLSASARKFLRGPRGAGFLYLSDRVLDQGLEPLFIDMRGADWIAEDRYRAAPDARRFENWESAWALVLATGEAARYAMAVGLDAISRRVIGLARRVREQLSTIDQVRVLDRGNELCGIVSAAIEGRNPGELVTALRNRGINTSAQVREYALLDYDAKQVTASLRISPHYYNTEDEIDQALSGLRELLQ